MEEGRPRERDRRRSVAVFVVAALMVATAAACAPVKKGAPGGRVLLVGDSVAATVAASLELELGTRGRPFNSAAQLGCGIVRGIYTDFENNLLDGSIPCSNAIWNLHDSRVESFRPDVVLWLSIFEEFGRRIDGGWYIPGPWPASGAITGAAADTKLLDLIEEKRVQLARYGAKLVFMTFPPPPGDLHAGAGGHQERIVHMNTLLRKYVVAHPGTTALIDLAAIVCPPAGQPPCSTHVDGIELRPDGYHFSSAGAAWVAQRIVSAL
jgi:hypothetical protein